MTLIFSLQRYAEVAEAYLRGLERLVAGGGDPRRCTRWRASSSRASTPRPTSASRRSARHATLQGKLAIANAKLAYQHYQEAFSGRPLGVPRGQGRHAAALPLGLDLDQEPGLPRRDLRRGADRPGHGQHDAAGDGQRLPGSRRGARQPHRRDVDEAHALLADARRGRRRLRRRRPPRSSARACRNSPTRSPSCSTASAPSSGLAAATAMSEDERPTRCSRRACSCGGARAVRARDLRRVRRPDASAS